MSVEKQASSEIAQSRERFEKEAEQFLRKMQLPNEPHMLNSHKDIWTHELLAEFAIGAERDTRERVAQELTDFVMEAAKLDSGKWPISVSDVLKLAERIRGKE